MLYSCLPLSQYPQKQLDRIWKVVLLNQFHDIIPGSSITRVYDVTHKDYNKVQNDLDDLIKKASIKLFKRKVIYIAMVKLMVNHCEYNYQICILLMLIK